MAGIDFSPVFRGETESLRDHVLIENRHEPDTVFLNTFVDGRFKITVYAGAVHGELWDLQQEPDEVENLWDDLEKSALKADLLLKLAQAQMTKDPAPMPGFSFA